MLMDMAKQNGLEHRGLLEALQKGPRILQRDRVQSRVPDWHRGMVKGQNHGLTSSRQLALQPGQLPRIEGTRNTTTAVGREQEQGPATAVQGRRGDHRPPSQGRAKQGQMVMVTRGQGQGHLLKRLKLIQSVQQTPIATPTLVLAEVSGDQEQIRSPIDLNQGLPEAMDQGSHGGATAAITTWVCQQMGIAELQEAWHTNRPGLAP
jgi:hypothetical protein